MQKTFSLVTLACFILCVSLSVFAQEKTISAEEFINLKDNASKKLKNTAHRVRMTGESYYNINDSAPSQFTSSISEYVPPDRRYYFYERKTDQSIFREETISVGQKKYIKQNDGSWKESAPEGSGIGSGVRFEADIERKESVEYKYKGTEIIHSQRTNLYEVTTTRKYKTPNWERTTEITERYWFNQDGMFLKTEWASKDNGKKVTSRAVWEYEYDPNIKIEAPKLVEESK